MCKISIIVPLYNGEKTIERCLDSLVSQTLKEIEIIVVNDGSKDHGEKIVEAYMKKDPRIRLFSQSNQGQGAARNVGIDKANGKYLGFVDCDDFVSPDMYSQMVNALEQAGVPAAVCQEQNVYVENGKLQFINETLFPVQTETVYSSEEVLKWQINYEYMSLNSMCYKVVERRLFLDYNIRMPEKYRYAEDMVTSIAVAAYAEHIVVVPQSLYYYVHSRDSFTYQYSLKHAGDIYLDWKEAVGYIEKSGLKINTDNFSLGMYFTSLKQLYWSKDSGEQAKRNAKRLKKKWRAICKKQKWHPDLSRKEIPLFHKIKIYVTYLHLCRPVFFLLKHLRWIPLFKYMV